MAIILGLDINPHAVRAVVLKTALRNSQVIAYIEVPIGAVPFGAVPHGTASVGAAPLGAAPLGAAPLGATPLGPAPLGPMPIGPMPIGTASVGAATLGPMPIGTASVGPAIDPGEGGIQIDETRTDPVRLALRQVLASLPQPPDRVITELSGQEVSIRKVTLPAKAAKRLEELLPFELEGKVPFDPAESIIDHQPVETTGTELRLLASVVPKDRIREHLDGMKALGIDPREVAVGAVALDGLVPLLPDLQTPGPHFLIDIHPEGTDICVIAGSVCHFARTLSVTIGDLDAGRQALLERELRQTLAAWRMEGGATPSTFFVCGEMAVREGTDTWLSGILSAPVEVLPLPAAPGADPTKRPAFARAAALAGRALLRGRHLDARHGEFATTQAANALRQHIPLMAGCAALVLSAFIFSSYARYSVLDSRHQQLEDQLASVTDEFFGTEARSADQAMRLLERGARGNDPIPTFDAYDALAAISEAIPEEITHDVRQLQIDLGDGEETARFSLRGTVASVSDTEVILRALEAHRVLRREGDVETRLACFHDLELGNTTATADERRSYRLEGNIRCAPEGQAEPSDDDNTAAARRRRRAAQ